MRVFGVAAAQAPTTSAHRAARIVDRVLALAAAQMPSDRTAISVEFRPHPPFRHKEKCNIRSYILTCAVPS
jgi:hypothetical protein